MYLVILLFKGRCRSITFLRGRSGAQIVILVISSLLNINDLNCPLVYLACARRSLKAKVKVQILNGQQLIKHYIMEFTLLKASDYTYEEVIEINSLEELKKLQANNDNQRLIIDFFDPSITVYDHWIE